MTKKQKDGERHISYRNDICFKYACSGDDEKSKSIRHAIIKAVTGIEPVDSEVLNPEIIPTEIIGKRIVMDVHIKDKEGREYNIEMQTSGSLRREIKRFQLYSARMLERNFKKGHDYTKLKPTYQIVFYDGYMDKNHELINHYQMMKKNGRIMSEYNLMHMYVVSLPAINKLKKKKGIENFTNFEKLCYLFKNEADDAILKVKEGTVDYYMEKYDNLNVNDDLWSLAWAIEFGEQRDRVIKEDMFEDGLKKGRVEGMEFVLHQLIHSKYHIDAHDWFETLTEEDFNRISDLLLTCDTFEQLTKEMNYTE